MALPDLPADFNLEIVKRIRRVRDAPTRDWKTWYAGFHAKGVISASGHHWSNRYISTNLGTLIYRFDIVIADDSTVSMIVAYVGPKRLEWRYGPKTKRFKLLQNVVDLTVMTENL